MTDDSPRTETGSCARVTWIARRAHKFAPQSDPGLARCEPGVSLG